MYSKHTKWQRLKRIIFLNKMYIVILRYINKPLGASNTALFTNKQNEIATIAKALGHPARIAIIEYLLKVDACICGDIVDILPLAQPTVSQHLKELKNAGLIQGEIEGNSICYCINATVLNKIQAYFEGISTKLAQKNTTCC
jgi:ArsR family transcriptional regulator, arsenate/arsenite/antimonite-responsive transcriptional repressor